jgi:protoheme IX farnesyltransferase
MAANIRGQNSPVNETIRTYLALTKLRIVLLLVFTTVTAMFIAADGTPRADILILTTLGGALAAAGASALNQYWDRDLDAKMTRTARRPIPAGQVSPQNAMLFGIGLIAWSALILIWVNPLTMFLALFGAFYYDVIYTMILKRNTVVNILIGGGAGAMPVLVGWAAVTGTVTFEALILFAIVFYWTPPHSWALALLVNSDYARADVPMMPVARGEEATRQQMLLYSIQLVLVSVMPFLFGTLGAIYLTGAVILGIGLLYMCIRLMQVKDKAMARATYKYTTSYLAFLFLLMIIDRVIL